MSIANWTQCPQGFVSPDNPSDHRNIYIQGTDCAASCMRPYYTEEQYQSANKTAMIASALGFALGSVLLRFWVEKSKGHYLTTTFIVLSLLTSLSFLMMFFDVATPMEEKFCASNAVPLDSTDGMSLCVVQGVATVSLSAALCLSWLAQIIDIYLTIVCGKKGTLMRYYYHYMALIYGYPFILAILSGSLGFFGYSGSNPYCFYGLKAGGHSSNSIIILIRYYTPITAAVLLGTFCFIRVQSKLFKVWRLGPSIRPIGLLPILGVSGTTGRRGGSSVSTGGTGVLGNIISGGTHESALGGGGMVQGVEHGQHRQRHSFGGIMITSGGGGAGYRGSASVSSIQPNIAMLTAVGAGAGAGLGRTGNSTPAPTAVHPEDCPMPLSDTAITMSRHRDKGRDIIMRIVAYCLLFLVTCAALIAFRTKSLLDAGTAQDSYNAWVACILSNYDGISDDSWIGVCGEQAEYYKSFYNYWYEPDLVIITGQSIIMCLIFYREFFTRKLVSSRVSREAKRIIEIRQSYHQRKELQQMDEILRGEQ